MTGTAPRARMTREEYLAWESPQEHAVIVELFQRQRDGSWRHTAAGPGERVKLRRGAELDVDRLDDGAFELPGDDGEPET